MKVGFHLGKKSEKGAFTKGRAVTQFQKEMIIQAFALCGNKSEVARQMGCSDNTVRNVIKAAESDKTLQKARLSALEDVAGQVHGKTNEIIQSIGPQDLESGLIKTFDKDDPTKLKAVKAYGPSLLQKVTSAAILVDKIKAVEETKSLITAESADGNDQLLMPGDVQSALQALGKKIKRLRILDVQFANKHEDTVSKVQEVAHKAELHQDVEEADYADIIDWDNQEGTDAVRGQDET
jgi:hypothetical protein